MGYAIAMKATDNPDIAVFHARTPLTPWASEQWTRYDLEGQEPTGMAPVTALLLEIEGVERIEVYRFHATVLKGHLYSWDEIAPHAMEVLLQWHRFQQVVACETPMVVETEQGICFFGQDVARTVVKDPAVNPDSLVATPTAAEVEQFGPVAESVPFPARIVLPGASWWGTTALPQEPS